MLLPVSEKKFGFKRKPPKPEFLPSPPEKGGSVSKQDDAMGLVHAKIELINHRDLWRFEEGLISEDQVRHMEVEFLVDTGAYMLSINDTIREQLGLPLLETRIAELANGENIECDVVGPVEIRYANRRTWTPALVLPGNAEPLLGAIPMEDMDLVVELRTQRLIVNPAHPIIPQTSLK